MQDEYSARCIFAKMPAISIWTAVQLSRLSILHELSSNSVVRGCDRIVPVDI
jgi:voltage-gated potassium channel Kch